MTPLLRAISVAKWTGDLSDIWELLRAGYKPSEEEFAALSELRGERPYKESTCDRLEKDARAKLRYDALRDDGRTVNDALGTIMAEFNFTRDHAIYVCCKQGDGRVAEALQYVAADTLKNI
jgi:hypothetical protein